MPYGAPYQIETSSSVGYLVLALLMAGLNILLIVALALLVMYRFNGPGFSSSFSLASLKRGISTSVILLISFAFLWLVRDLLIPFGLAFFLASLLDPVVSNLQKRGIPRGRGVGYIFATMFLGLALSITFVLPRAADQIKAITDHPEQYEQAIIAQADVLYLQNMTTAKTLGMKDRPSNFIKSTAVTAVATSALNSIKASLMALSGKVLWFVIIPLSLFYFLLDFQVLRAKAISFFPIATRPNVDKMSAEVVGIFSQYIRGLAKVCMLYGLTAMIIALVVGVPYAVFLGLAAGALYAVPYAGPAIAIAGSGVLALTTGRGGGYATVVVILFMIMHVSFDYGITPRVVGGSVGLHPLLNIFALMVGATFFGIWGMLLAVPVAACVQMVLLYFFPHLGVRPQVKEVVASAPDELVPRTDTLEPQTALD